MASNKFLIADSSTLLKNKLDKMSLKLQGALTAGEFQTQEEYLVEAIKVLQEFYASINDPQMPVPTLLADQLPDFNMYNDLWTKLLDDLTVVFREMENIEGLTIANFNFITTESNRLTSRLKAVSSKLGDYILYSLNPTKDAFFFKDSFNDLSKIDIGSPLLNSLPCEVNQEEGTVTLPVDLEKDSRVTMKENPVINPDSNGVVGNNQQVDAKWNGDLKVLLDNNPDTWFEYERVVSQVSDTKEPLVLDITLNLGSETVINHIRVNPNNFGTKTVIQIDTIETSLDGKVYTNIKDDIPIAGFTTEDEENVFALAPSTSKFAGQGIYTFTPRKVKYIHFVFRQTEPYLITTPSGDKLRYAIGIRDIDIRALHFINIGELITTRYLALDIIRKVMLQTNQIPIEASELASIQYYISTDDGATWSEIRPKEVAGVAGVQTAVPEILDFNGEDPGSIQTPVPVQSLRMKMVLKRNDDAFAEGASSFRKTILSRTEMHEVPANAPFNFTLDKAPVDGTVVVIDPMYGSRGIPSCPYVLGHTYDRFNMRKYFLPMQNIPWPVEKISDGASPIPKYHIARVSAGDWIFLEVGGERWAHATTIQSSWGSSDKVFLLDPNTGIVSFGNGTKGKAPGESEPITLYFGAEQLFPSEAENNHVAKLDFPTGSNKKDVTIKRYDLIESVTETLPRQASVIHLKNQNLVDITGITSVLGGGNKVDFLNGIDELVSSSKWSIDTTAGIIYMGTPTSDVADTVVKYSYQPIYTLTAADWEWASTNILRDSVKVLETAWKTIAVPQEYIKMTAGARVFDLAHLSVVKGSLVIETLDEDAAQLDKTIVPFFKEVEFKDGATELGLSTIQTVESIAPLTADGVQSFYLSEGITLDASFPVTFSNTTIFQTLKGGPGSVTNVGDYYIDRSTRRIYVFVDTDVPDFATPGTVTYYYVDTTFVNNGLYSVDYKNGRIYTQRTVLSTWICTAAYNYIDIRAEYRVGRFLDLDAYEVDITNRIVTIKDSETLANLMIPQASLSLNQTRYYLVSYDSIEETRENIADLKELFTPVIKDYALKIITKGKIF
jgi:hypothetical protein